MSTSILVVLNGYGEFIGTCLSSDASAARRLIDAADGYQLFETTLGAEPGDFSEVTRTRLNEILGRTERRGPARMSTAGGGSGSGRVARTRRLKGGPIKDTVKDTVEECKVGSGPCICPEPVPRPSPVAKTLEQYEATTGTKLDKALKKIEEALMTRATEYAFTQGQIHEAEAAAARGSAEL